MKTARRSPAVRRKSVPAETPAPRLSVAVDYPMEGEAVHPGHYAIRVAAEGAGEAEVSIDEGTWEPCRADSGFFWLDWQADGPGPRVIAARARVGKGRWALSDPRRCEVVAP